MSDEGSGYCVTVSQSNKTRILLSFSALKDYFSPELIISTIDLNRRTQDYIKESTTARMHKGVIFPSNGGAGMHNRVSCLPQLLGKAEIWFSRM